MSTPARTTVRWSAESGVYEVSGPRRSTGGRDGWTVGELIRLGPREDPVCRCAGP